ncbi:hypothetical protein VTI74DRAFT_10193 [Chaetomium olivicolor]
MLLPAGLKLDLSPGSWTLAIGSTIILANVVSSVIIWWRFRHFKGHWLTSFSYSWLIWASGSGRMAHIFHDMNKRYGDRPSATIRIGPNELITSDAEVIRRMNGARSNVGRAIFTTNLDQGFFVCHGLTQKQCESEAVFHIVAGTDTTAAAIRTTLLYLMTTPLVYRQLQAEIDEGIKAGRILRPAVILQGFRLHAPLCGFMFKVAPPGGDTIENKHVPGGTLIMQNFWSRWLDLPHEEKAEMRRMAELVFGYGRWGLRG